MLVSGLSAQLPEPVSQVEGAEGDEMWSIVGNKSLQHWLWYAIAHNSGKILAYVSSSRKDEVFSPIERLVRTLWHSTILCR